MTRDPLKILLDTSQGTNNEVHKHLIYVEKKLKTEYIGSALFSMIIDAQRDKIRVYTIPERKKVSKLYFNFKLKG